MEPNLQSQHTYTDSIVHSATKLCKYVHRQRKPSLHSFVLWRQMTYILVLYNRSICTMYVCLIAQHTTHELVTFSNYQSPGYRAVNPTLNLIWKDRGPGSSNTEWRYWSVSAAFVSHHHRRRQQANHAQGSSCSSHFSGEHPCPPPVPATDSEIPSSTVRIRTVLPGSQYLSSVFPAPTSLADICEVRRM